MFKINFLITIIFLTLVIFISNGKCNGQLFIIGGGDCPAYMMKKFVVMSGGEKANIAIIPLASSVPLETALFQKYEFEKLGAGKVDFAIFTHETADADSNISLLNNATSIFFSGGGAHKLTVFHTPCTYQVVSYSLYLFRVSF